MQYLALGALLLAILVWAGRRPILKRREWRFLSGGFALVAFTAAAFMGLRGMWAPAIVLLVVGLWLAVTTRVATPTASRPAPRTGRMNDDEARNILGVDEDATPEDIQAAYTRLMRMAHPDKGGTSGLAAQLNAARDRLLKR
jgi:hypothetical protein